MIKIKKQENAVRFLNTLSTIEHFTKKLKQTASVEVHKCHGYNRDPQSEKHYNGKG